MEKFIEDMEKKVLNGHTIIGLGESLEDRAALSGALEENNKLIPGDTKIVSETSNLEEKYENITSYIYKNAVSPHLVSKLINCDFYLVQQFH